MLIIRHSRASGNPENRLDSVSSPERQALQGCWKYTQQYMSFCTDKKFKMV